MRKLLWVNSQNTDEQVENRLILPPGRPDTVHTVGEIEKPSAIWALQAVFHLFYDLRLPLPFGSELTPSEAVA